MLNQLYPDNGTESPTSPPPLPGRPRVSQVVEVLKRDHGVPDELVDQLCEAFGRAAMHVVDDVVADRKTPLAYYAVRRLDSDGWWQR